MGRHTLSRRKWLSLKPIKNGQVFGFQPILVVQARKIAKVLGIAQKVNGKDQKLGFLVSQIKLKLQQATVEIVKVVQQELLAC